MAWRKHDKVDEILTEVIPDWKLAVIRKHSRGAQLGFDKLVCAQGGVSRGAAAAGTPLFPPMSRGIGSVHIHGRAAVATAWVSPHP